MLICGIGVADEGIIILLQGREFSSGDLILDFIDVGIAVIVALLANYIRKRNNP